MTLPHVHSENYQKKEGEGERRISLSESPQTISIFNGGLFKNESRDSWYLIYECTKIRGIMRSNLAAPATERIFRGYEDTRVRLATIFEVVRNRVSGQRPFSSSRHPGIPGNIYPLYKTIARTTRRHLFRGTSAYIQGVHTRHLLGLFSFSL